MYTETTATRKLKALKKRVKGVAGGTSASKTISILLILIAKAQSDKVPTLTSVMSESMPHLKRGAMRDFLNIMQTHNYYKDERWNRSDYIYTFETGSKIEFFSLDMPHKVRGPRRDRGFINEANNNPKETYDQLEVRTKEEMWLDWNPTTEFWFYEDLLGKDDVDFVVLTYKDNEALDQEIVRSIESRRENRAWWRVYGEGLIGEVEGKIYTGWKTDLDSIPHEARLERRGLDFGYSQDPAAIVDVYYYNGGYILDEQLYRKGMGNKALADFLNNLEKPQTVVVADSAEPKSIDELKLYGINVLPAQKGAGSITQGINYIQGQQISVTKRSVNLIKEYRNYLWKTDRDGKILTIPEGGNDHALDATRYALSSFNTRTDFKPYKPQNMVSRKHRQ